MADSDPTRRLSSAASPQRWLGPDFLAANAAPSEQTPAPTPGPTVAELEAIETQAREAGYQAGLAQGQAAAAADLAAQQARFAQLFTAMSQPLATLDQAIEQALTELALDIAKQVIYRELQQSPELIKAAVQTGLAALPAASQQIRVRVHPEDAALLGTELTTSEEADWRVIADPSLQRGDVLIDSEMSHVDARVEQRIERVAALALAGTGTVGDA